MTLNEGQSIDTEGLVPGRVIPGEDGSFFVHERGSQNGGYELMAEPLYPTPNKPLWTSKRIQVAVAALLLAGSGATWKYLQKNKIPNTPTSIPLAIPAQTVPKSVPPKSVPFRVSSSEVIDDGQGNPGHMFEIVVAS